MASRTFPITSMLRQPPAEDEGEFQGLTVPPIAPSPLGGHWCTSTTSCMGTAPTFPAVPDPDNGEVSPRTDEDAALTDDDDSVATTGTVVIRRYDPYATAVLPPLSHDASDEEPNPEEIRAETVEQSDGDDVGDSVSEAEKLVEPSQYFSLIHAASLQGHLGFLPYPEGVVFEEVPEHIPPRSQAPFQSKMFLGHLWVKVGTSVVQWLIDSFALPLGCGHLAHLCAAQRHINKSGYYAGCAHAMLVSERAEDVSWVMNRLHKRILFDLDGVWFAENEQQQAYLAEYCAWLCGLPQTERHAVLQGLPCNPIAVEFAQNVKGTAAPAAPAHRTTHTPRQS